MTNQIDARPKSLSILMLVSAVFALAMMLSFGLLIYKMSQGREAIGDRVEMQFSGRCVEQAKAILDHRVSAMGLGEVQATLEEGRLSIQARLPGIQEDALEREHVAKILSQRALWQLRFNGDVLLDNDDIRAVSYGEDSNGYIEALLRFDSKKQKEVQSIFDQSPEGISEVWLDDRLVIKRPNTIAMADDFRFVSEETDPQKKSQETADFVILLSNPPVDCQLNIDSVIVLKEKENI